MTYGEVRDYALKLINQYSIAGENIPPTYNNQEDYYKQAESFIPEAMQYIATTAKPIPKTVNLRDLDAERYGAFLKFRLPHDALSFSRAGMYQFHHGDMRRYKGYHTVGDKEFLMPVGDLRGGEFMLEYYRYPRKLKRDSGGKIVETQELDGDPETHPVVAFYAASHMVMYDDAYRHSSLYNEFETRLSRLGENRVADYEPVTDVYAFDPSSNWNSGVFGEGGYGW